MVISRISPCQPDADQFNRYIVIKPIAPDSRTVEKHLECILPQLGVETRTAASAIALNAIGA
jgi:hypothetical protein